MKQTIFIFKYLQGTKPELHQNLPGEDTYSLPHLDLNLGSFARQKVSNLDASEKGREYFDMGLRLMMSYQHELAAKCMLACLQYSPDTALAHGLVALCHSPNYNFKGEAYYESACHFDDVHRPDLLCVFPSQQVAERHSAAAVAKMEELKRLRKKKKGKKGRQKQKSATDTPDDNHLADIISEPEAHLITAVRILTGTPGVDPGLSELAVGRPFADAMRKAYQKYPQDPEIVYWFAESLMVLNAWQLYEYPSGQPLSPDVVEVRTVLEKALQLHPHHPGLCHLYVHLSEMSAHPAFALKACQPLRTMYPHAGHLIHMPTQLSSVVFVAVVL